MKVLKKFDRNGQRYKPGDPAPSDLDAATLAHYKRHGMVGTPPGEAAAPAPTKAPSASPAGSGGKARAPRSPHKPLLPGPVNTQALAPQVSQTAAPVNAGQTGPDVANLAGPDNGGEPVPPPVPPGDGAGAGENGGDGSGAGPVVPPLDADKND